MPNPVTLGQLSQKTPQRAAPARPYIPHHGADSRGTERMPQAFLFLVNIVTSAPLPY